MLRGEKILITGPASQVGFPVARALAPDNEVVGLARFGRTSDRERVEALGVRPFAFDLADAGSGLDALPDDFTLVLHFAVVKSGADRFAYDLAANAEGLGRLMHHCRRARAFLHCSSAAVYAAPVKKPAREDDPLGDHHRVLMPTYSICKIAAEVVARFAAREWSLPTTIARLSVPYGSAGGWPWFHLAMMKAGRPVPVHPDAPNVFNPIHEDDVLAHLPRLLAAADTSATVLNWGGEPASIEDWCRHMGRLTGLEPRFHYTENTLSRLPVDLTRMHERIGPARVGWRDGIRRMIEAREPDLLAPTGVRA